MKQRFHMAAALAAFSLLGCFDQANDDDAVDFDRAAMLANLVDRVILPGYARLDSTAEALNIAVEKLVESPDSARAEAARTALRNAWLAWQGCSIYELGPAAEIGLRLQINAFPTNAPRIEENIAAGTWSFQTASNYVAKGFPALDYMLHGRGGSIDTLLAALRDSAKGASRGAYFKAVAGEIAAQASRVREGWDPEGKNYRESFISRLGSDRGSSLGILVNNFAQDYEILKNARIGIPLGEKTLQVALPEKVEGYYAGYSLALARAHLDALENLFRGRDSAEDGPGFDDYLEALGTRYQEGKLSDSIKDRFAAARAGLESIPDPLSQAIIDEKAKVKKAYDELQGMVVLIKTDMPSAFSISIEYQDTDGD